MQGLKMPKSNNQKLKLWFLYEILFEKGKFTFLEKTLLDRPMYAIIRNNKMYVILRKIDTKTHFGGILSFDINVNGNLINPTEIENTNGIVPCHLEVLGNNKFVVNYLSGNIVNINENCCTVNPFACITGYIYKACVLPTIQYGIA